jgi:hypothetical protein
VKLATVVTLDRLGKGVFRACMGRGFTYVNAQGRWFSPGTSVSSTTKVSRHDIAEILLKAALSTINQMNLKNI